jgi:sugar phosphate permease
MWYKRSEAQKRYSFFFNSTTLAGAFGGLLAAAIGKMDGLQGYKAWRWIFIIEGGLTVFVSFFFYFMIPDFPEEVKWLSKEERKYVQDRLRADVGSSGADRPIKIRDVLAVLKDYKVIAGGFAYFGLIVPAYGYAYFAPGIIKQLNYGNIETQLRSVPPWAVAFAFSMTVATISDRLRHRFLFVMLTIGIAIAGFAIEISVHNHRDVQYAGLFLVAMGAYTAMPIIVCWFNMNLGGHFRRSIGSAWQVGFGNLGGIIAVYIFLEKDKPQYIPGYSVCLAWCCLSIVAAVIYGYACHTDNKKRDALPAEVSENMTLAEKDDLGDLAPDYRYLL